MSAELWQAVLLRTVADAVLGVSNEASREVRVRVCEEARRYLTRPNPDLAQVCTMAGMDTQGVIERMRRQIANAPTPEELADNPRQRIASLTRKEVEPKATTTPFKDCTFTIDGIIRTAAEWCAIAGISLKLAQGRIKENWPPERAFILTIDQVEQERRAATRRTDRLATAERSVRIKEGLRRSEALFGKPKGGNAPVLYEHNGETRSLTEWAEITGIGRTTLHKRITVQGMTFAQAIDTPVSKGPKAA